MENEKMRDAIACTLRGKYQLLVAGFGILLNSLSRRPLLFNNIVALELELDALQAHIRELKREFKGVTGIRWEDSREYRER